MDTVQLGLETGRPLLVYTRVFGQQDFSKQGLLRFHTNKRYNPMCALSVGTAVAWQVTAKPGAHCAAPLLVQGAWTFDPLLPLSRAASVFFRYFPIPIHCAILDLKLRILLYI